VHSKSGSYYIITHTPRINNTMVKATLLVGVFVSLVICVTCTDEPVNNTTTPEPSNYVHPLTARWIINIVFFAVSMGLVLVGFCIWGVYEFCQKAAEHTSKLVQNPVPLHMRFSSSGAVIQPLDVSSEPLLINHPIFDRFTYVC
jgi:hypothetical protein